MPKKRRLPSFVDGLVVKEDVVRSHLFGLLLPQ